MSDIQDSLGSGLLTQTSITTLVATLPGSTSSKAITPLQGVEGFTNAFPRIIFARTSDVPVYSNAGRSSIRRAVFTIECQGKTIASAAAVRDAVLTYLDTLKNNASMGSNKVHYTFVMDEYDQPYPAIHGEEKGIQAKTFEIEMGYS